MTSRLPVTPAGRVPVVVGDVKVGEAAEVVVVEASVVVVGVDVDVVVSIVVVAAAVVVDAAVVVEVVDSPEVIVDPEPEVVDVVEAAPLLVAASGVGPVASSGRNQAHPPTAPAPTSTPSIARKFRRLSFASLTGRDGSSEALESVPTPNRFGTFAPVGRQPHLPRLVTKLEGAAEQHMSHITPTRPQQTASRREPVCRPPGY
jgi:hypothetical protein